MVRHYHHQYHFHYQTSFWRHFGALAVVVIFIIVLITQVRPVSFGEVSLSQLFLATVATLTRLTVSYFLALIIAFPLALLAVGSPKTEKIFLPIFDVLQSIPVLAFFPMLVLFFLKSGFFEAAAIFVLIITMVWSVVFSLIGGVKSIPADILAAAKVFGAKGSQKIIYVILPAVFPFLLTGSLLAWANGWSIIMVAEAIHNYLPPGAGFADLFGLGSLLVSASYHAQNGVFIDGLITLVLTIGLMNFFIWQKLLQLAQKFKFDA